MTPEIATAYEFLTTGQGTSLRPHLKVLYKIKSIFLKRSSQKKAEKEEKGNEERWDKRKPNSKTIDLNVTLPVITLQ